MCGDCEWRRLARRRPEILERAEKALEEAHEVEAFALTRATNKMLVEELQVELACLLPLTDWLYQPGEFHFSSLSPSSRPNRFG